MSAKSILEIDVSTGEFQRYKSLFDQYTEQLKKQPALWAAVAKQHQTLATQLKHTSDALDDEHSKLEDIAKIQDGNERGLIKSESLWASMATSSETFAKNLISAGGVLAKWGIGAAVAGVAGIFGLDHMAHGVADQRRSAMGLGLTTGQQKAFDINFGRVVDPNSFLSGINSERTDLTKQANLYGLGVDPNGSTSDVAVQTLRALRAQALSVPANELGVIARQFNVGDLGMGLEDLQRLRSMSGKEFNQITSSYQRDSQTLGFSDRTGKAWTDFVAVLARAEAMISKTFVNGLLPLAGPVEHLATAFSRLLSIVMRKDGVVEQGITHLANWVSGLAGTLDSGEFLNSVSKFTASINDMADVMNRIAHPVDTARNWTGDVYQGIADWFFPSPASVTASPQAYMNYLGRRDSASGLPAGTMEALFQSNGGQLYPTQGGGGGTGPFQISPILAKQLGIDAANPLQAANGGSEYLGSLFAKFHGDIEETLTAFKLGPDHLKAFLALIAAHPGDWKKFASKDTQDIVRKIDVVIHTIPGANVTVAASQAAH